MHTNRYSFAIIFIIALFSTQIYAGDIISLNKQKKESTTGDGRTSGYSVLDYHISYNGYFKLSPDDKSIIDALPGAKLEIRHSTFGNIRRIEISSDSKGVLTRKYYIGKSEEDFEKEGKQWLSDILPKIVRHSGIGAESRIDNIYKNSGIDGLLKEVKTIDEKSSGIRNLYFVIIVNNIQLSEKDLSKLIPAIAMVRSNSTKGTLLREILYKYNLSEMNMIALLKTAATLDYNTERGSILRVLNPKLIETNDVMEAYFSVIDGMEIHSEKGNVLKDLISGRNLSNNTYIQLFNSVDKFELEREKGAILLFATRYMPKEDEVLDAFVEVVDNLPSAYYVLKGEIMNTLTDQGIQSQSTGDKRIILQLLETAEKSPSSSQKGLALRKVNRMWIADHEVYVAYRDVLSSLSEWSEKYNVLLDLISLNKLDEDSYKMIFASIEDLASDYQHAAGAVLRALIPDIPLTEEIIIEFFNIIQRMDQNSTIEEILRLIVNDKRISKNELALTKSIEALDNINVDIETATVLLLIKPGLSKNGEIKYAYKSAAKDISSEYLSRMVLSGIN